MSRKLEGESLKNYLYDDETTSGLYIKYTRLDWLLLVAMAVISLVTLPWLIPLLPGQGHNQSWVVIAVCAIGITAFYWQTKEFGRAWWLSLLSISLGLALCLNAVLRHAAGQLVPGLIGVYSGIWCGIRSIIIKFVKQAKPA